MQVVYCKMKTDKYEAGSQASENVKISIFFLQITFFFCQLSWAIEIKAGVAQKRCSVGSSPNCVSVFCSPLSGLLPYQVEFLESIVAGGLAGPCVQEELWTGQALAMASERRGAHLEPGLSPRVRSAVRAGGRASRVAGGGISLPVVAILRSVFVITLYKMALLFADQVYPDINKTLAVIGCDSSAALPPLPAPAAAGAPAPLPGVIGFDGYWLLQ